MKRKIIQITVVHAQYNYLMALCDDGTVWVRERAKSKKSLDLDTLDNEPAQSDWTWNKIDTTQIEETENA
jgi:hypothetical protein